MLSGDVLWCSRRGSYATKRGGGLAQPCTGRHMGHWVGGGRRQQLYSLRRNAHPVTGARLPPPIAEQDGGVWPGAQSLAPARTGSGSGSAFGSIALAPSEASLRMEALRERIRAKELAGKSSAAKRRLRSKTRDPAWGQATSSGASCRPAS